jgi:hypothetical protein
MHDVAIALQPDEAKSDPFEQTPRAYVAVHGPCSDAVQSRDFERLAENLRGGEKRHVPAGGTPTIAQYPERAGAKSMRQITDGHKSTGDFVARGSEDAETMSTALHHELHGERGKCLATLPEVEPPVEVRLGEPGSDVIDIITVGFTKPA